MIYINRYMIHINRYMIYINRYMIYINRFTFFAFSSLSCFSTEREHICFQKFSNSTADCLIVVVSSSISVN